MTKKELIDILHECAEGNDPEVDHARADEAMVEYINDPTIATLYNLIKKWYA